MTPERWQLIRTLFAELVELDGDTRARRLEAIDEDLRGELASLLEAFSESADLSALAVVAGEVDATVTLAGPLADAGGASAPQHIGVYRVLRELGVGGMGRVYLARRDDEAFDQTVAIKVLQAGMASAEMVLRFRAERQILASLRHPNIARLLDGGTTEAGQPYLVMEYVDGERIDTHCDRRRLPIEERLRLFRKVCAAVHSAHQNLVVHRDLKPGNIVVDETGEPKLLDFGIAKLLAPEEAPHTVVATGTGLPVLTPAYAAPEQVRGGQVTTSTDVYSLGVLLFELLTGHRPYELSWDQPLEALRRICHESPKRPSSVVLCDRQITVAGEARTLPAAALAAARGEEPRRLGRHLAGDLDTIVLRALAKEPERRYGSAEQLAFDLDRHLAGLPVEAREDTFVYRASKFVRRHRLAVAAATVAITALLVLVLALARQSQHLLAQRLRAEEISEFLVGVFEVPDPSRARGEQITARELLHAAAADIESELVNEPAVRADLMATMGRTFDGLGLYEEAEALLTQAQAEHRQLHGAWHPLVAEDLDALAQIRILRGHYGEAEALATEALQIRRDLHGERHADVVHSRMWLARAQDLGGESDVAAANYRIALGTARALGELELLAAVLDRFARLHARLADYETAEAMYGEALEIWEGLGNAPNPEMALALNDLAALHNRQGKLEEAEAGYRRAVELQRKLYPDGRHSQLATTLGNLGLLRNERGHLADARELLDEALSIRRAVFGENHPLTAHSLLQRGDLALAEEDFEAAESLHRSALQIRRELLGRHVDTSTSLDRLALVLARTERLDEAEAMHGEALEISREALGPRHPQVAEQLNNLALLAMRRERLEAAEGFLRESLAIKREVHGDEHPSLAPSAYNLALLLIRRDDLDGADTAFADALELGRASLGDEHVNVAVIRSAWASVKNRIGQAEAGEELATRALAVCEAGLPVGHSWTRSARRTLAESLRRQGRLADAAALLEAGLAKGEDDQTRELLAKVRRETAGT